MLSRSEITSLLVRKLDDKHKALGDIFATEVQSTSLLSNRRKNRLKKAKDKEKRYLFDAVAIKKSFSKPCITIYEVKSCKEDFATDTKWENYLPNCHQFYFIAPKGAITKEDLPEGVGLITVNLESRYQSLYTVVKADHRKVDLNFEMLMTIVNRCGQEQYKIRELKSRLHSIAVSIRDLKIKWPKRKNKLVEERVQYICSNLFKKQSKDNIKNKFDSDKIKALKKAMVRYKKNLSGYKTTLPKRDVKLMINDITEILEERKKL